MNLNSISTWLQEMFKTEASQSEGTLDEKGVVNLVTKLNNNIAPARVQQKVKVSVILCLPIKTTSLYLSR